MLSCWYHNRSERLMSVPSRALVVFKVWSVSSHVRQKVFSAKIVLSFLKMVFLWFWLLISSSEFVTHLGSLLSIHYWIPFSASHCLSIALKIAAKETRNMGNLLLEGIDICSTLQMCEWIFYRKACLLFQVIFSWCKHCRRNKNLP